MAARGWQDAKGDGGGWVVVDEAGGRDGRRLGRMVGRRGGGGRGKRSLGSTGVKSRYQTQPAHPPQLPPCPPHPDDPANPLPRPPHPPPSPRSIQTSAHFHPFASFYPQGVAVVTHPAMLSRTHRECASLPAPPTRRPFRCPSPAAYRRHFRSACAQFRRRSSRIRMYDVRCLLGGCYLFYIDRMFKERVVEMGAC